MPRVLVGFFVCGEAHVLRRIAASEKTLAALCIPYKIRLLVFFAAKRRTFSENGVIYISPWILNIHKKYMKFYENYKLGKLYISTQKRKPFTATPRLTFNPLIYKGLKARRVKKRSPRIHRNAAHDPSSSPAHGRKSAASLLVLRFPLEILSDLRTIHPCQQLLEV